MGLAHLTEEERSRILDEHESPHADGSSMGLTLGKGRKLLEAFRQGRWRGGIDTASGEVSRER